MSFIPSLVLMYIDLQSLSSPWKDHINALNKLHIILITTLIKLTKPCLEFSQAMIWLQYALFTLGHT